MQVSIASHLCCSMNLEGVSDDDLKKQVRRIEDWKATEVFDDLYADKHGELKIVWTTITDAIREKTVRMNDELGRARFAFYVGRRLLFLSTKMSSNIQAYILYAQAMILLQQLVTWLGAKRLQPGRELVVPPGDWMTLKL